MNVSYDYYRIFYYVAKYGNLSQAAKHLLNNQPNLTRSIKNLEAELGCTLFSRTNRGAFDKTGGAPNTHSANDRTQREADALQGVLAKAESARTLFTLDAANCAAVCYSQNNGQDDVLLCGSMNGGVISLPRLALGYYVLLSLTLLITLGIAFFVCRRKKTGKALGYLALIPASYLAGHLLVKGFTTTSYQMQRDFSLIILAAALIYAAVMLAINLWRQKREKV